MLRRIAHVLATIVLCSQIAMAADFKRVTVNGRVVEFYDGNYPQPPLVLVDGQVAAREEGMEGIRSVGVFEAGGRTLILLSISSGARVCVGSHKVLDLTAKPILSEDFAACVEAVNAKVVNGRLTMRFADEKTESVATYIDGKIAVKSEAVDMRPAGSERAPGGNMALHVIGKSPVELLTMRAPMAALQKIMPPDALAKLSDVALRGPQSAFKTRGDHVIANVCERHNCGMHHYTVMFDQGAGVWVRSEINDKVTFYGQPNEFERRLLGAGK
jgi:hypothetical protein